MSGLRQPPKRMTLPPRRMQITRRIEWANCPWDLSVGFYADGRAGEVFVKGKAAKVGSDQEALVEDACVLVSLLLQTGWLAEDLIRHLGRESTDVMVEGKAASLIGLVVETVADVERDEQPGIAELHGRSSLENLAGGGIQTVPGAFSGDGAGEIAG